MNGKLFCELCGRPFDGAPAPVEAEALDGPGSARSTDPGTSWGAAKSNVVRKRTQRALVLVCHYNYPEGMTDSALERHTRLRLNSCSTRRSELSALGYVEKSGEVATTEAGVKAVVWRITPAGREYVEKYLTEGAP